jgi:hypothetical protein
MRACHHFLFIALTLWTMEVLAGSSLCLPGERAVWECAGLKKAYAVCASPDLAVNSGYLQYRAGVAGHVDFEFPAGKLHPKGNFLYENYSRFARLTFENGGYAYEIEEQLVGPTTVRVTRAGKLAGEFACLSASRTLMDSEVIRMFSEAGVSAQ